jgi:hypothetical protein
LRRAGVKLLALTIDPTLPATQIEQVATQTGGRRITEARPADWAAAARRLAHSAAEARMIETDATVTLPPPINANDRVDRLNETWLRDGATQLAEVQSAEGSHPAAAEWRVGAGRVVALPFAADASTVVAVANAYATEARDPRFASRLINDPSPTIRVEAIEDSRPMNSLELKYRVIGEAATLSIPQTAPGRYEITLPRSALPRIVEVMLGNRVFDRIAVAGRYAEEFDRVGINRANLQTLAERSGGSVIDELDRTIDLPDRYRNVAIAPWLAAIGAILLMVGLIDLRRSGSVTPVSK